MATTARTRKWIVCADYVAGPYMFAPAERVLARLEEAAARGDHGACRLDHVIEVSDTKPEPHPVIRGDRTCAWCGIEQDAGEMERINAGPSVACKDTAACRLRLLRAEWDRPVTFDPSDEDASRERGDLTRDLAAAILTAPLMTNVGGMVIKTAGWSKETGDAADAIAESGSDEWITALGAHEHATLTADGGMADREHWCHCPERDNASGWVRYEAWTADGCEAHGFVCFSCRKITQTG